MILRRLPGSSILEIDPYSSALGAHAACIIQCLGIAVGKALLECLLGSRTLREIEECLKGKAITAVADAIECIARCLGLIP
jgi:hypothetical protein